MNKSTPEHISKPVFTGVGVALITLFDRDNGLAAEATAAHAVRLVELGVRAILVAGSTGEAAALDPEERLTLLNAVRSAVPSRVPVIVGTGQPSARQAATTTEMACDHGADAVLVLSPPRSPDPRPYFETVANAAGDTPLLAYHFPAVSAPGITVDQLVELPVSGCKDSSGDPARFLDEVRRFTGALYVGSPTFLPLASALGAAGAILAVANVDPENCIAAFNGDVDAQRNLIEAHLASTASFPSGIKGLTAGRFGTSISARMG
ncbi:MAG: dihydrodipicolinate synthase family protein [Ferrimicrobium sp.]